MPTYEYVCTDCGEPLEVVQSIHDDALTECPNCGGKLRKVFGNVGVVFKGSGFYKTDSRKSGKASPSSSGTTEKKDSTSEVASTKAESKPSESSSSTPKKKESAPSTAKD